MTEIPKTVRDVTGAELWPADKPHPDEVREWPQTVREPAVVHFERLIRQLEAQGYKDHEIEAGLEQIVYDEFRGK